MTVSDHDLQVFHQRFREVENAPLKDRKEAAAEWLKAMRYTPEVVAERIGWLFNGSYGQVEYEYAWRILNAGKRANRVAQLAQLIAVLEWNTPPRMAAEAWKKLREIGIPVQNKVNAKIAAEIAEWETNEEYAHMRKNPARRTTVDPITHRRVRIKSSKQQAGGTPWQVTRDGQTLGVFSSEDAAWKYLHRIQSSSIGHAVKHEGYNVIGPNNYDLRRMENEVHSAASRSRMKKNPHKKRSFGGARHTSCRHCGDDIEGIAPYRRGEWRDRGNNTTCNDGRNKHAPYIERKFTSEETEYNRDLKMRMRNKPFRVNPRKRTSKKKLSPKQAAWRKEFARRVKAGVYRRGRASKRVGVIPANVRNMMGIRPNPKPRKHRAIYRTSGGVVTHVEARGSRALKRAHGVTLRLQPGSKRVRKNPVFKRKAALVLRCILDDSRGRHYAPGKKWWLHSTGQCLTDDKGFAKRFTSDADALRYAQEIKRGLVGTGVVKVTTERGFTRGVRA
jgi:hypothetical protein